MKYKLLGKSGLRVSELALGTMTLSLDNPWEWGTNKENSLEIMKSFTEAGGNFIDTANNYQNGQSEKVIGEFIKGDRDRYVIATKFTLHHNDYKGDPNYGGNQRKNLLRSVNSSLERLDTDYVDLLYLHVWDYTTPIEEVMKTLDILVQSTKVNYIGISDTPAWVVSQANMLADLRGWSRFVAYQFPYHIGRRDLEDEVIPYCRYNDLAMTTWGILSAGLFTGKYTRNEESKGRLTPSNIPEDRLILAKEIDSIADELGVPSSHVTIAWTRSKDNQIIPIIGATKAKHIQESIDAVNLKLDQGYINQLNTKSGYIARFPQSFTGADNVQNLIHGDTYEKLVNHRFRGF